jgi:hypothetical protein
MQPSMKVPFKTFLIYLRTHLSPKTRSYRKQNTLTSLSQMSKSMRENNVRLMNHTILQTILTHCNLRMTLPKKSKLTQSHLRSRIYRNTRMRQKRRQKRHMSSGLVKKGSLKSLRHS